MTLYEIEQALQNRLDAGVAFDEKTGEVISDEDLDTLVSTKTEGYALYIKNLDAEAKAIREEEQKLAKRRQRLEKKSAYLSDALFSFMARQNKKKFETPRVQITSRKCAKVKILDEDAIIAKSSQPGLQNCVIVTTKICKAEVKKHIGELEGAAEIEEGVSYMIK